jgi:transposase
MKRFVEGEDRRQGALLPHCLDDYVTENNPVRVIEAFIDELDLATLGFDGVVPEATGRPAYHPATLLKIYLYGYLNRTQSSRRLEREAQRNIELMWLTGVRPIWRPAPGPARDPAGIAYPHRAIPTDEG